MATVNGMTAEAMQAIRNGMVIGGHVDGASHLILEMFDGSEVDAGYVKGDTGSPTDPMELPPCRATDQFVNIPLSGLTTAVDGVTPVDGDRILVKHQTTASENDIWVAHAGPWTRDPTPKTRGMYVRVKEGIQNRYKTFTQIEPDIVANPQNWHVMAQVDYGATWEFPAPQSEGHLFFNWVDKTLNVWGAGVWTKLTTALASWPVGSIYMSVDSANPGTIFGGTWVAWGTGRVPVAIDTGQTEFNTIEKTGGEKAHTLTMAEIPDVVLKSGDGYGIYSGLGGGLSGYYLPNANNNGQVSGGPFNAAYADGGGASHNNLQPYITCYMWKRTA